ncbi:MAG: hypothetical protein HY720_32350 [Planctomycetes bacterium]|nr:hypothetical protein [Planctomycetota bacterium]
MKNTVRAAWTVFGILSFLAAARGQEGERSYDDQVGEYKNKLIQIARRFADDPRGLTLAVNSALQDFQTSLSESATEGNKSALDVFNETLSRFRSSKSLFRRPEEKNIRRVLLAGYAKVNTLEVKTANDLDEPVTSQFWWSKYVNSLERIRTDFPDDPDARNLLVQAARLMFQSRLGQCTFSLECTRLFDNCLTDADRTFPIDGEQKEVNQRFNQDARASANLLFQACRKAHNE